MLAADSDARLISGGQTLIPMMAMRLARPSRLIDIGRLAELRGIREEGDAIVIGAATKQVEAERSALIATRLPLLSLAMPWVGHAPTRARGTIRVVTDGIAIGQTIIKLEGKSFSPGPWDDRPVQTICVGVDAPAVLELYRNTLVGNG